MTDKNDKSLREGLHVLFLHADPAKLIRTWLDGRDGPAYRRIPGDFARKLVHSHPTCYSQDDGMQMAEILRERYAVEDRRGVFGPIFDFAGQTLTEWECRPVLRYEQTLRWRDTVHPLGTLPFLSAFLAREDVKNHCGRASFSLDPVPRTDNGRLRAKLDRGMAENHFHLKGSAPPFHLSWVCLMNDVTGRRGTFEEMEGQRLEDSAERPGRPLYVLAVQAAAIRAHLFQLLMGLSPDDALLRRVLSVKTEVECQGVAGELQAALEGLRAVWGVDVGGGFRPDYAVGYLADRTEERIFDGFSGEYWFQYSMFRAVLENAPDLAPCLDLFYAYLCVSIRFRAELIQSNRRFGFRNFSDYDGRKSGFLAGHPAFQDAQLAVAAMTRLGDPRVRSLEARIVPELEPEPLARSIRRIDRLTGQAGKLCGAEADEIGLDERLYYVLHIPKRPEEAPEGPGRYIRCRDAGLREKVHEVISSLIDLREGCDGAASRIRGMDACASEADTRPEAFAPAFRRIKRHQPGELPARLGRVPMVHLTYHVGEDFPDVADGLRAVWEAIEFLEMGRSDRLGHGLVLGIDAAEWYEAKHGRVLLTRQALLDNCAWMLTMLRRCGVVDAQLEQELQQECATQYAAVYQASLPDQEREMPFDVMNYFKSMELRGDEPACYFEYRNKEDLWRELDYRSLTRPWSLRGDEAESALYEARRRNWMAIALLHHYHFNPEVKACGAEPVEYHVSDRYIQAAARLQARERMEIARRGIGIETNPSSNVLIGNFKRYDKHPLIVFNDRGLTDCKENPNLFVSINTDDQGVFATSLENEYALMSRGLEQMTDQDGAPLFSPDRVYGWLDHVREMGLEQSFLWGP